MKICFLASGGGGNLKFFHLAQQLHLLDNIELTVIADRECPSVHYAREHHLYATIIQYTMDNNHNLLNELEKIQPDFIVTNWHKIIDAKTVSLYKGKLINLHYSLLPSFGGLIGTQPIEAAYRQGCKFIGATCHFVDIEVDAGQIIAQTILSSEIPFQNAIQATFQKGCLLLLNSLLLLSDNTIIHPIENQRNDFSPALQFDDSVFTQDFWERLSIL